MNIICFSQQNWDVTWTDKQHYMTRLARRGHRVLYLDKDPVEDVTSLGDRVRALAPLATGFGLREVEHNLYVATNRHAPWLPWRLNEWRWPWLVRALVKRLGFTDPVGMAFHPDAVLLMNRLHLRARVYYATDEMSAFANFSAEERQEIREREDALLRDSDLAFAVSPRLLRRLQEVQPNSFLLENGVDPAFFHPARLASLTGHPAIAALPRPRLGLVGQIDERVNQSLLTAAARARPEWQVVLVGRVKEGVDVSALAAEPNIHFIGFQPFEELPRVLRELDVCTVPYHLTKLTHSCNPAKIYEYVAAGRPVVATPLEGILACREVVALAATPEEFVRQVELALADPEAGLARRLAIAAASDWERRTDVLEQRIQEALARTATAPVPAQRRHSAKPRTNPSSA